eukprot:scaffold3296_cov159-Ochromonas_danica.AAC.19
MDSKDDPEDSKVSLVESSDEKLESNDHPEGTEDRQLHLVHRKLSTSPSSTESAPFPPSLVPAVMNCLQLHHLVSLELVGSKLPQRLKDRDVIVLSETLIAANVPLRELRLPYHAITVADPWCDVDVGLEEICRLLQPSLFQTADRRGLELLDLTGNAIEGGCLRHTPLMSKYDCPLTSLNLSCNALSAEGRGQVSQMLKSNRSLRQVFLNCCGYDLNELINLFTCAKEDEALERLELDRPLLTGWQDLSLAVKMAALVASAPALSALSLRYHELFDHHAKLLAEACLNGGPSLVSLNLEGNKIGVIGAEALASALLARQQRSLEVLRLSFNHVCDDGAIALAQAIEGQATNLRVLTLKNNNIGPVGLTALANALDTSVNLQQLLLFGNHFDNGNGQHFLDLIQRRLAYSGLKLDISVYVVDGAYTIAEKL